MSRKTKRILFVMFIALCLGMIFGGGALKMSWLSILGISVLFGGSFLAALILSIVVIVAGVKGSADSQDDENDETEDDSEEDSDEDSEPDLSEAEEERRRIEKANSTYGVENRIAHAEHTAAHVKKAFSASDKKEKVLGTVLLTTLLLLFFGGLVLAAVGFYIVGFACLGGFVGIIITAIIITAVKQRISLNGKGFEDSAVDGTVTACVLSSSSSVGGKRAKRITSAVYKVKIDVGGDEKIAYSREFYNAGDSVKVRLHKKRKSSAMIEED